MSHDEDSIDLSKPFTVTPLVLGIPITMHNVTVQVDPAPGGQEVRAWITDDPDSGPVQDRLEIPGVDMPNDMKREAYFFTHPDTHAGVALAINPVNQQIIGYFGAHTYTLDDLDYGIPEEWL